MKSTENKEPMDKFSKSQETEYIPIDYSDYNDFDAQLREIQDNAKGQRITDFKPKN